MIKVSFAKNAPKKTDATIDIGLRGLSKKLRYEIEAQLKTEPVASAPALGALKERWTVRIKGDRLNGPHAVVSLFGRAARMLIECRAGHIALILDGLPKGVDPALAVEGTVRGLYGFDRYRTKVDPLPGLSMVGGDTGQKKRARVGLALAEGTWLARDLVNTPAEDMGPQELEDESRKLARTGGLKLRTFSAARCRKLGMGAITAVGRASVRPPRIVVLEYRGAPRQKGFLALAGKGICFDTGGLDLKPAAGMLLMKKDMGGAATVLGAAHAVARIKPRKNIRFYLAIAENAVSGNAIRPGDVVRAYDGTTIEIGNTDAEGRLVLADAVALARKEGASAIVDAATLTGAALIALGRVRVPMMATDAALQGELEQASVRAGEKVWPFPTDPEYRDHIKGKIADLKNVGKGREAGVIAAGLFIEHFAGGLPWAHLDISPASWSDTAGAHGSAGATGVMVSTLARLAAHY